MATCDAVHTGGTQHPITLGPCTLERGHDAHRDATGAQWYSPGQAADTEHEDERARAAAELADMTRKRDKWQWYAEDAQRQTRCQRERAEQTETALARVRAVVSHLDEFADAALTVSDRKLYAALAGRLRAAIHGPAEAEASGQ